MPTRNLDKLFRPKNVAIIGASNRPGSVGNTVLQNMINAGFSGKVYPINPKHSSILDLPAFPSVASLLQPVDLAIIATPAPTVPQLVAECGEAGIRGIIILSAGFREVGGGGVDLEDAIRKEAARFDGLRIIGPNCLGLMSPGAKLNASFSAGMPSEGRVAFLSQSGALCTSVLDWAMAENIGFSHFVSIGNALDVGLGDFIDYFAEDDETESIIVYIESIKEAREFMSAARAFTRNKPIIAYKAGRFEESAQAAASHTGAMAGVDTVYEAAFARAGIVRIFEVGDMFDCAELLARHEVPKGARLAIVTNAGGPGVMTTDALLERKGVLATLSDDTLAKLNEELPASWSHNNPVDILGDAPPERFGNALKVVLADKGVDAALVVLTPQAMTDPAGAATAVVEACKETSKPVLTAWMGGDGVEEGKHILQQAEIPNYGFPEQAVRAFSYLVSYARRRDVLYETPRDIPVEFPLDRKRLRAVFDTILSEGYDVLTESTSKALLDAYEIPVTKPYVAWTADDAVQLAKRVGYPVVMKVHSPQITHKTDVGGVVLNLANDAEVTAAFDRIVESARKQRPDARVEGVTVQRMVTTSKGMELIVGANRDPVFGTVLLVGAGGITAEILQDRTLELPPLTERLAHRMLKSLRCWPLLKGYRGRTGVNIDRLIEILMRISYLVADYPEIQELDINPLVVTPDDVVALDARIILDRKAILQPPRPYSHLAIRPYPDEWIRQVRLSDDTPVLFRPIKPEDEPMWHDLLASCSRESLFYRFRYTFKSTTHEMATRYCFIDYDREIAIVVEVEEEGQRKLIGVGRLVAGSDLEDAEFAVIVTDAWQKRGVGSMLAAYAEEICRKWGIRQIVAETAPDNHHMLRVFRDQGYAVDRATYSDATLVKKELV